MFKAAESWRLMTKERFVKVMHMLLYTKVIGSQGALDDVKQAVKNFMTEYYAAVNEV